MKTWKKVVATENDVEFEYSDRLERPVLACQGLFLPFSAVFRKNGASFNKNGFPFKKNGYQKSGGTGQDMTAFRSMSVYGF